MRGTYKLLVYCNQKIYLMEFFTERAAESVSDWVHSLGVGAKSCLMEDFVEDEE